MCTAGTCLGSYARQTADHESHNKMTSVVTKSPPTWCHWSPHCEHYWEGSGCHCWERRVETNSKYEMALNHKTARLPTRDYSLNKSKSVKSKSRKAHRWLQQSGCWVCSVPTMEGFEPKPGQQGLPPGRAYDSHHSQGLESSNMVQLTCTSCSFKLSLNITLEPQLMQTQLPTYTVIV